MRSEWGGSQMVFPPKDCVFRCVVFARFNLQACKHGSWQIVAGRWRAGGDGCVVSRHLLFLLPVSVLCCSLSVVRM